LRAGSGSRAAKEPGARSIPGHDKNQLWIFYDLLVSHIVNINIRIIFRIISSSGSGISAIICLYYRLAAVKKKPEEISLPRLFLYI
jgi:hypothetical protein